MDTVSVFGRPPVHPDDRGKGPALLAVSWTMTGLATIVVALRFVVRKRFVSWRADDWIMLAALVLQFGFDATLTIAVSWGFGRTLEDLTLRQLLQLQKWEYITALVSATVSVMARISITVLLIRIFGSSRPWFRHFAIVLTAVTGVMGLVSTMLAWLEKFPVQALWDFTVTPYWHMDGRVNQYMTEASQFLFAIYDFVFVLLPVSFIWQLHRPFMEKAALVLLLGLSLITMGSVIAKGVVLIMFHADPVGGIATLNPAVFLTTAIEQCLVIILGCMPTLGPVCIPVIGAMGESLLRRHPRGKRTRSCEAGQNNMIDLGTEQTQS
ncbi:hypothetical protein GQ53DRAFT_838073 [Thozetella sp. PMI_491]|nr:hypothetical protein GQ53DRAFT_838073 [Thozetella sp. PMI_491]